MPQNIGDITYEELTKDTLLRVTSKPCEEITRIVKVYILPIATNIVAIVCERWNTHLQRIDVRDGNIEVWGKAKLTYPEANNFVLTFENEAKLITTEDGVRIIERRTKKWLRQANCGNIEDRD